MDEEKTRLALADLCGRLYDRRLVSGVGGNAAARCGEGLLVTETGVSLAEVTPESFVYLDAEGRSRDGRRPSKEAQLHRAILSRRPAANVVAHTHAAYTCALSAIARPGRDVLPPLTPGFAYFAWPLPMVEFELPGSQELTDAVAGNLPDKNAILLASHGLVTWGASCRETLIITEEIEEAAKVFIITGGRARAIPDDQARRIT
ncbi:MAG: class II aldolase/adducin family protein [Planctomycetota bacterium]